MMMRAVVSVLIVAAFLAGLLFVPQTAAGQPSVPKANDIPRLPNGKPDFNGVWDHPRVADVTKDGKGCGSYTPGCAQKGAGELQFTPPGLAEWKDEEHRFDYSGHCLPWGYTRAWQVEYPVEIVQTPERMAILFESNNIFHVVHTDGSQHPKNLEPTWMGNSIGWYEGDTLVIDSIGFNGKTWIDTVEHPSSDALHVIEHIHFIDSQHLAYDVTWEDSKTYTKPIQNTRVLSRMKPGEELMEYWCMENNRDLPHLSR
jgi:hypothetical protein